MALKYGFYDSVDGDRVYSAKDFTSIFNNLITDGVLPRTGNRNQFGATPASSGLGVTIDSGWAWFDSTYTFLTAPQTYALDAADAVLYRWDAVVIQTDNENRTNEIIVVKGTPATENSAVKPTLTANQHPICYAKVTPGLTKMVQGNIENRVGFSDCPWITGVVGSADLTQVFAQWQYDFDEWFENLRVTLSGDVAANLLNRIEGCEDDIEEINTKLESKLEQTDLVGLGLVKMLEVNGTIATSISSGSRLKEVNLNNSVTIPLPTDAIAYVYLKASVDQTASYTTTVSRQNDLIIDMTQKRIISGKDGTSSTSVYNTAEQPSVITVADGAITISGKLFRDTWSSSGTPVAYSNNTPLTYYVKYLTKVPQ